MTILITGFDPFGGESINPSWQVVQTFDGQEIGGHKVIAHCLPTAFAESLEKLQALMDELNPSVIIAFGQAGGRASICLERIAININDARISDNNGEQPIDCFVMENGPAAYFSRLPIKSTVQALRNQGIPANVSNTAGTFVCNHVFYGLMHLTAPFANIKAGFVHIPYLPEQSVHHANTPSMSFADLNRAVSIIIQTTLANDCDDIISAGTEC